MQLFLLEPERVAIVGSRDYPFLQDVVDYVDSLAESVVIVSGGARGVDLKAEEIAGRRGMRTLIFPAQWETYGRKAGFIRNRKIVDAADRVVAFWDGASLGTKHTISLALGCGKPLLVFPEEHQWIMMKTS